MKPEPSGPTAALDALDRVLGLERRLHEEEARAREAAGRRIEEARAAADRLLGEERLGDRLARLDEAIGLERDDAVREIERWREGRLARYRRRGEREIDSLVAELASRLLAEAGPGAQGPSR